MYLTDFHCHSICSPDGNVPIGEMAAAGKALGLVEMCITDHCDLLNGAGERTLTYDWMPVLEQYRAAKVLEDEHFSLKLGLELGGAQVSPEHARTILGGAELDFVIGSIHNKSETLGGGDFYYVSYSSEELCHEMLADYFASLLEVAQLGLYDSLGHVIYPLRYMNRRDGQNVTLERHWPVIREILTAVLDQGKAMEVNTYCGRTVSDWRETLELYRSLGGHLVTLGSDAHHPENMGKGIVESCALLKELGFEGVTTYQNRKPVLHRF